MLTFKIKQLQQLSSQQLYRILKARCEVFVVEQQCAYPDIDDVDLVCWHVQGCVDNDLVCYARIIPPSQHTTGYPAIGRVLTTKAYRGNQYGRALMMTAIDFCQQHYPNQPIVISAQTYLIPFYQSLRFMPQGEYYLEDGIEHIDMILDVKNAE